MARAPVSIPRFAAIILAFFVVGVPLGAYIWETFNQLLAGHFALMRVLITVPLMVLALFLLRALIRFVDSLDPAQPASH